MGRLSFGFFLMGFVCVLVWGFEVGLWSDFLLFFYGLGVGV